MIRPAFDPANLDAALATLIERKVAEHPDRHADDHAGDALSGEHPARDLADAVLGDLQVEGISFDYTADSSGEDWWCEIQIIVLREVPSRGVPEVPVPESPASAALRPHLRWSGELNDYRGPDGLRELLEEIASSIRALVALAAASGYEVGTAATIPD